MDDVCVYESQIDLNHGHDGVKVRAIRGYGDLVEIEFEGRDPTTVTVRLTEPDDVRALGNALIAAANALANAVGQSPLDDAQLAKKRHLAAKLLRQAR